MERQQVSPRLRALFCALLALTSAALAQSTKKALIGVTLLDGSGGAPLKNSVVLIDGQRISAVGTVDSLPVPAGYEKISTEGMTLLPGLWDMHVHLLYAGHTDFPYWHRTYTDQYEKVIMPATARQLLMAGVTSTRDLGAPPEAILSVKKHIANGDIPGATIYAAGPQLTHQPPDWATKYRGGVSGPADAKAKVNQLADMGVDQIKVTDAETMTLEDLKAVAEAAHARGLKVAAHGRTLGEIRLGLAAGFDEFEHIGLQEAEYPPDLIAVDPATNSVPKTLLGADRSPTAQYGIFGRQSRDSRRSCELRRAPVRDHSGREAIPRQVAAATAAPDARNHSAQSGPVERGGRRTGSWNRRRPYGESRFPRPLARARRLGAIPRLHPCRGDSALDVFRCGFDGSRQGLRHRQRGQVCGRDRRARRSSSSYRYVK